MSQSSEALLFALATQ